MCVQGALFVCSQSFVYICGFIPALGSLINSLFPVCEAGAPASLATWLFRCAGEFTKLLWSQAESHAESSKTNGQRAGLGSMALLKKSFEKSFKKSFLRSLSEAIWLIDHMSSHALAVAREAYGANSRRFVALRGQAFWANSLRRARRGRCSGETKGSARAQLFFRVM